MDQKQKFVAAYPYQDDIMALPVLDLDLASEWYTKNFGMSEVERYSTPNPTVILERDGVKVGFSINGGDAEQHGGAILVSNIHGMKKELSEVGLEIGNWREDERDGDKYQVFFIVAPDGLCYYFHEKITT
jgi:catechol 2,3-dioxygenase-like lactoylglutathione lyase family enzyme